MNQDDLNEISLIIEGFFEKKNCDYTEVVACLGALISAILGVNKVDERCADLVFSIIKKSYLIQKDRAEEDEK